MARSMTFAAATRAALQHALRDDDVLLVGDGVGCPGSSTEGLEGAVRALPAADRGIVGVALGMALAGKRVVVELPSARHLSAVSELLTEAGRLGATEHGPHLVVRVPYGEELAALDAPLSRAMVSAPGVAVWCAASPQQEAGLLLAALRRRGATVLLSPRSLQAHRGDVSLEAVPAEPRTVRSGHHVTLAAWGAGVIAAEHAADVLHAEGISAEVIDLVSLLPLPTQALSASVQRTGRLVVAHPHDDVWADQVRAVGLHGAFLHLESPLAQVPAEPAPIARAARDAVFY